MKPSNVTHALGANIWDFYKTSKSWPKGYWIEFDKFYLSDENDNPLIDFETLYDLRNFDPLLPDDSPKDSDRRPIQFIDAYNRFYLGNNKFIFNVLLDENKQPLLHEFVESLGGSILK